MRSPYGLEIVDHCASCRRREGLLFCSLPAPVMEAFESLIHPAIYPKGAMLFVEGQSPRGTFVLCSGRVKLSTGSRDGKTLIMHVAEPGEMLGLSATLSGESYEVTAETLEPCQVNFIKREDFLNFLSVHQDACLKIAQLLSNSYHNAYDQIRSLALSNSCAEKLARLLLDWSNRGEETNQGIRLRLGVTHEEIAQMIGTSRETVTRLFGELKTKQVIRLKGPNLLICNKTALETLIAG